MILVRSDELVLEVALREDGRVMWSSEQHSVQHGAVSPAFGALQLKVYGIFIASLESI